MKKFFETLNKKRIAFQVGFTTAMINLTTSSVFATASSSSSSSKKADPDFNQLSSPIVSLLNSLLKPALAIVVALGSLYCVILGVKYAKAEEPQDREKAKAHLKSAIIGFVLIFVLIAGLNILNSVMGTWADQYNTNVQ